MNRLMAVIFIGFIGASCEGVFKKDVRAFIEGSYVRDFENEFAVGIDSIVLQEQGDDHYLILKYSRFSRFRNNEWLPQEQHEEKMAGIYDERRRVIDELKKGKVLQFNPEKGLLLIGASEYRKVK